MKISCKQERRGPATYNPGLCPFNELEGLWDHKYLISGVDGKSKLIYILTGFVCTGQGKGIVEMRERLRLGLVSVSQYLT